MTRTTSPPRCCGTAWTSWRRRRPRRRCGAGSTPSSTPPGSTRTAPATGWSSGWSSTRTGRSRTPSGADRAARRRRAGLDHALHCDREGRPGLRAWSGERRPSCSVNVGRPQVRGLGRHRPDLDREAPGRRARSRSRTLGLDGDQVSDTEHHGGVDQAVYAFAREDLDRWAERLGQPIRDGQFGENLTTSGIDVNEAEVGERWRIGTRRARGRVACGSRATTSRTGWGSSGFDDTALGQAVRRRGPARALPAGRRGGRGRGRRRDRRRAPARPRRHRVAPCSAALHDRRELLPELLRVDGLVAGGARARPRSTSRAPDRTTVPPPWRSATGT